MKAVLNWIALVLATVVGGSIVVILQGPINNTLSADRLRMDYYISPWHPIDLNVPSVLEYPGFNARNRDEKLIAHEESLSLNRLYSNIFSNAKDDTLKKEFDHFALAIIGNKGKNSVTDVRITFSNDVDRIIISDSEEIIDKAREVNLPDLKPGEAHVLAFFDSIAVPGEYFNRMETFSSEGKFVIRKFKMYGTSETDSGFENFMNEYGNFLFPMFTVVFAAGCFALANHFSNFIMAMFCDENIFARERDIYLKNKKAYFPEIDRKETTQNKSRPNHKISDSESRQSSDARIHEATEEESKSGGNHDANP